MAWDNAVVTNAGISLLQQVLAGETLTLDKAAGGTGTVPASALMAQIGLKEQKQELPITSVKNVSNGKKVCIQITNVGLASGYIMQQVGIWAHIGNNSPVLFAILQDDTGIAIPSRTEIPDFAMNLYAVINFSNESNFSLSVEPSALVTQGELNERLNERIKNINANEIGAETPEGAQAKADAAAAIVQANLNAHTANATVHVTADEKELWNAKETPAGAQAKADAAAAAAANAVQANLDAHAGKNASTSQAGHVKLSSATNSNSEDVAATPKAVKGAMDAANSAQSNLSTHESKAASASALGHVYHAIYNVTLDTSWSGSSAPFSKTVTVNGIQASDTPIIDVVMSGTYATDTSRLEAWSKIYRAVTEANKITFYATEKPTVSIPVQVKVVR